MEDADGREGRARFRSEVGGVEARALPLGQLDSLGQVLDTGAAGWT